MAGAFDDAAATKANLAEVKAELKADFAAVKAELKGDIAAVKSDLMQEFAGLKADVKIFKFVFAPAVILLLLKIDFFS